MEKSQPWYALPTVTPSHSLSLFFTPPCAVSFPFRLSVGLSIWSLALSVSVLFCLPLWMGRQRLWQPTNTHTHTDRHTCTLYNMKLSFHIHTRSMHLLNTHITSHSRALCFLIIIIIGRRQSSMWFCGYGRLHLATHRRGLPEVGGVSGPAQSSIQFGGHLLHLLTAAKCICSSIYVSVDVSMYLYLQPSMTTKRNRN